MLGALYLEFEAVTSHMSNCFVTVGYGSGGGNRQKTDSPEVSLTLPSALCDHCHGLLLVHFAWVLALGVALVCTSLFLIVRASSTVSKFPMILLSNKRVSLLECGSCGAGMKVFGHKHLLIHY